MDGVRVETGGAEEVLMGVMFATRKELRHQAERLLGRLFVPLEVRSFDEQSTEVVLRPSGMGEIHVHARRELAWHPYRITRVETVLR
jgi:hypothetical protein